MPTLDDERAVFVAAARWADGVVRAIPDSAWTGPGLGDWTLRALVGHTSRSLLTVERYLSAPAETEDVSSAEDYFAQTSRVASADAEAVLRRGIDAGEQLGAEPASAFGEIVDRVTELLLSRAGDPLILTIAGGMRVSRYLPTRTFELVVHGLDVAAAIALPAVPPEPALLRALDIAAGLAVRAGEGPELLLALTGRRSLATGYSVLP